MSFEHAFPTGVDLGNVLTAARCGEPACPKGKSHRGRAPAHRCDERKASALWDGRPAAVRLPTRWVRIAHRERRARGSEASWVREVGCVSRLREGRPSKSNMNFEESAVPDERAPHTAG